MRYYVAAANAANAFGPLADLVVVKIGPAGEETVVAVRTVYAPEVAAGAGYACIPVAFECKGLYPYEVRLYGHGNAELYLDRFYVEAPALALARAFKTPKTAAERRVWADKAASLRSYLCEPPPGYKLRGGGRT